MKRGGEDGYPEVRPLTREEVRGVDRTAIEDYGLPGVVLMENAGRGAVDVLTAEGDPCRVAICCGRGNNGGDGTVMARHLAVRGWQPSVHLFADPATITGDAKINLDVIRATSIPVRQWPDPFDGEALADELARADWIVDALLGTGLAGPPRSPAAEVIQAVNASDKPVLAVDIPSGLDGDTGEPLGATVRATVTCTFVARKLGLTRPAAAPYTGTVHVIDIGVPADVLAPYRAR